MESNSAAPEFHIKDPGLLGELKGNRGISIRGSESDQHYAVNNKLSKRQPGVVRWNFHDELWVVLIFDETMDKSQHISRLKDLGNHVTDQKVPQSSLLQV